jgi:hypothetical protein
MYSDREILQRMWSFTNFDRPLNMIHPAKGRVSVMAALSDSASSNELRDLSLWSLVYERPLNTIGLLGEVAAKDQNPRFRKSSAWALMKLGAIDALKQSLAAESDANIAVWKQHLLNDLNDTTGSSDTRAVRMREGTNFDFTMPLEVEGIVEFRDPAGKWHTYATGPVANERLIGKLTPGVNTSTFDSTIVLQKRIRNINGSGRDHVEGYLLKGLARLVSENVMRHQYEAISTHDVYPSGGVGDESQGKMGGVTASLERIAETYLSTAPKINFPYQNSVRGTFKGFVFVNPSIVDNPDQSIDGRLQIISPVDPKAGHLVNGIFHGSFRGAMEDIDGDGVVELNGIEMLVEKDGSVTNRNPLAQQW